MSRGMQLKAKTELKSDVALALIANAQMTHHEGQVAVKNRQTQVPQYIKS